jgi:hypothetical protein
MSDYLHQFLEELKEKESNQPNQNDNDEQNS